VVALHYEPAPLEKHLQMALLPQTIQLVVRSAHQELQQDNLVPPDQQMANHKIPGLPRDIPQIAQLIFLKILNPQKEALLTKIILITA
jgi:hypothetical protein